MGLVRLFLALVVAADHWWVIVLVPMGIAPEDSYKFGFNNGYAVMFFYVISGFLITYTLRRNYRHDLGGMAAFYRNRFIRIFSLYWPLVILTFILIAGTWTRFVQADIWDQLTGLFLIGMDWRLAFAAYPSLHWEAAIGGLHQAWTLGAELVFYLAAPFLMRSWKIGATLLVLSFGLRAYFVATMGIDLHDVWTYHFAATTFGFFMLGHLACLFARRLADPVIAVFLLFASLWVMTFGQYVGFDAQRFWISVVLFTLSLPGLFEATKNIRWMNLAGDLSYPVYLVHTVTMLLAAPWLREHVLSINAMDPRQAGYVSLACFLVATVVSAVIVHRLLEMPVAWAMKRAFESRKMQPA